MPIPMPLLSVVISNKHGIYELPHELPNYVKFRILGIRKYKKNLKTS